MDAKAEKQEQLDESSARLQGLEAEAAQRNADGAKSQISSLAALRDRLQEQIDRLDSVDDAQREQMRDEIEQGIAMLSDRCEAAAEQLVGFDDLSDDEQLDAEIDQVDSAAEVIIVRLDDEASDDPDFGQSVRDDLRDARQSMNEAQAAMEDASDEKKSELRSKLQEALTGVKQRIERIVSRLKSRREEQQQTEQRV